MSTPNIDSFEAFDRLAGALEDFVSENGHFRAMCPAHEGHRPALTISVEGEPPNRKTLLHCHAGCGLQEILDALDLTKSDLFERSREASRADKIVAMYDYVNLSGNLVHQTTRHEPKEFKQRRPNGNGGWIWSMRGVEPVLYNLPAVTRTIMEGGTVFVCEGEKDCDRANEVLGAAGTFTTCPMGSGKWRDSYTQALRSAHAVLIPDNDGPGRKHGERVARELLPVAKSVKMLTLPEVPENGGDLSDWLDAGGTFEAFDRLVQGADFFLHHKGTEYDEERKPFSMSAAEFVEEAGERPDWVVEGILAKGAITSLAGLAKYSGKTTYVTHMVACILEGKPFLGRPTKATNVVYATEQGNNFVEALRKAGLLDAAPDRFRLIPYKRTADMAWDTVIEKAIEECETYGAKCLIVDTFAEFAQIRGTEENNSGDISEKMKPLKKAARIKGLAVEFTRHAGKDGRARGSSQFEADVDIVVELKRGEGDSKETERKVESVGRYDAAVYKETIELTEGGYISHGYVGASATLIEAKREAKKVIPTQKESAISKREIWEKIEGAAFSESTLYRALDEMLNAGEISRRKGAGKGNPWLYWRGDFFLHHTPSPYDEERKDGGGTPSNVVPIRGAIGAADGIDRIVEHLKGVGEIALDLETMPPNLWWRDVVREYKAWRRGLKGKPKPDRMRAKWTELKAKIHKAYAVDPTTAVVRLVSVATADGLNEVVDASRVDVSPLLKVLKDKTLITHNGSFDLGVLRERYGYVHRGRVLDTQLLYLLYHYAEDGERTEETGNKLTLPDPTKKKGMTSLATLADKYLNISLDKSSQASDWSVPNLSPEMVRYALEDSRILVDLSTVLVEKLEAIGMKDVVDLESQTLPAIVDMERNGFPASVEVAREMGKKYAAEARASLAKLNRLTPGVEAPDGREWHWTVPDHVWAALMALGANLDELPKTKTGEPSIAKDALRQITGPQKAVEWVETYLNYSALQKQENDFVNTYAGLIKDGVIRGSYTKTVATGRLSCRKPNLQQVPSRGELQTKDGMRVRSIFRAPEGQTFIVADFAQVELLLAATIADEEEMLRIFREGGDIHRETAAWVLGKQKSKVTKAERTLAKALNFGLIYGCSAERLLESATNSYGVKDLTLKKAKTYRRAFFETYPALKRWHEKIEADCNRGVEHAHTPLGRRRKLPYWKDSAVPAHTVAKNAPVQGAGADAIKLTLAKLFEDRHNCPGNPRLRCSVHDEVVLTVEEEYKEQAISWVERRMAKAEREVVGEPDSPIAVDVEARESW